MTIPKIQEKRRSDSNLDEANGYERRRERIRTDILNAAERLVRKKGSVEFTMRDLALRAGVSPATPFNHFGGKAGVLRAIVRRSLEGIAPEAVLDTREDPVANIFEWVHQLTTHLAADAKLHRPVLGAIIGNMTPTDTSLLEDAIQNTQLLLEDLRSSGLITRQVDIRLLAEQIEANWQGTAYFWAGGLINGDEWADRVEYSLALILSGVVVEKKRNSLLRRARQSERNLLEGK